MDKKTSFERWENLDYQKIKEAKFMNNNIIVSFENGDLIEIPKKNLVPDNVKEIEWEHITSNAFEVIIPAKPNSLEIPWDSLRVLTDKDFGKYLAKRAEEQAQFIGVKIKNLREKKGIRSNELAERAEVTPQTISRIEQGHTDVNFATLQKILAAMGYSLKDLANQGNEFEGGNLIKSFSFLIKRMNKAGIDNNLLTKKIFPIKIQEKLRDNNNKQPEMLLDEAASYISNIYGWGLNEIWSSSDLKIKNEPATTAYFKAPANANINHVKAYSHYAFYLAKIILKASPVTDKNYPSDIDEFKLNFIKLYKNVDFKYLLNYAWDLGICVLPLNDFGVFHGASWNIDGRHVIVLKQNTKSHARWIFDLLHELYHVFVHLSAVNTSVIETEEMTPFSNNDSVEELEANSFAKQVLFGPRVEELAEQCVDTANWKLENLKNAVKTIAKKENIREDFLANYLAFRLSFQGQNWWSTAMKMQVIEPDPFLIAVDVLKKKISLQKLNPMDFNLLNTAISN